jgi:CxxC-x17-CxxC domain-containing protein
LAALATLGGSRGLWARADSPRHAIRTYADYQVAKTSRYRKNVHRARHYLDAKDTMYKDETLQCADCAQQFTFSASQQEFFAQKGFTNKPTRCQDCRDARKAQRGGGGGGGGSARPQREMFAAVCAACHKPTEVPFKPRNDKPVYCRDCFSTRQTSR